MIACQILDDLRNAVPHIGHTNCRRVRLGVDELPEVLELCTQRGVRPVIQHDHQLQSITTSRSCPSCTITSSRLTTGVSPPLWASTVTTTWTGAVPVEDCCATAFASANAKSANTAKVRR